MSSAFTRQLALAWVAFFAGFVYGAPPASALHVVAYAVTTTTLVVGTAGIGLVGNLIVSEVRARVTA